MSNKAEISNPIKASDSAASIVAKVLEKRKQAKLDKEKALILPMTEEEQKVNILELENLLPTMWKELLESEIKQPYFRELKETLQKQIREDAVRVFPPIHKVFRALELIPELQNIRAIICAQDCYFSYNQAEGFCFSVPKGEKIPSSLQNIYKELHSDMDGFVIPQHGHLLRWAEQGVLMLNASLTVQSGIANSHKDIGWQPFTDAIVKLVNENCNGCVWMLWGQFAQKKAAFVDEKRHKVLRTVHPSGLSASRGWFGSKHFSQCNAYLLQQGKTAIDWQV
jgi:uracil-DNA glycosylase